MIRPAVPGDLPALAALERQCFSEPWPEDALRRLLTSDGLLLTAEADGEAVGLLGMQAAFGEGYIHNVAVRADCRRRGIGRALLCAALDEARRRGVLRIALDVRASNGAAAALYEGCGFRIAARRPSLYAKPREDGLTMLWEEPGAPAGT